MIKRWILIFGCVASMQVLSQDHPSLYQLFIQQAERCVIEPSWTIPSFLDMNVQEFKDSWIFFVKTMTLEPHCLVNDYESNYSERKHRELLIGQCNVYDTFLSNLVVSVKESNLLYALARPIPSGYVSIFEYARQQDMQSALWDFYAFYFDKLAANYIEQINNAALNCDHVDFIQYRQKAQSTLYELYMVYQRLYGSDYDARYGSNLKNYQDIFQMLMAEKRKLEDA